MTTVPPFKPSAQAKIDSFVTKVAASDTPLAGKRYRMQSSPDAQANAEAQAEDCENDGLLQHLASMEQRIEQRAASMEQRLDAKMDKILNGLEAVDLRVKGLEEKVSTVEESMDFVSEKQNEHTREIDTLKKTNAELVSRLTKLEKRVDSEEMRRDDLENNSTRLICLELGGVPRLEVSRDGERPREPRERPREIFTKLLQLIGSENSGASLDVVHRKKSGAIIAKFKSREARDEVFSKRFALRGLSSKDLGFNHPHEGNALYLNESLTFDRSKTMANIKKKLRSMNAGKDMDSRIRVKSNEGRILTQKVPKGQYYSCPSMQVFDNMHPNDVEIDSY